MEQYHMCTKSQNTRESALSPWNITWNLITTAMSNNNASVHSYSETSDFHVKVFQLAHSGRSTVWVQGFLLMIFLPRLSARSWDHSPLLQKPFSIGTVPPGLPAEAAPWRATPLSESIKAQLPRADWPRCLAKGGRMFLSLPGSGLLYYGPARSHLCINLIRSNQVQDMRGGRQLREKLGEGSSESHQCLPRQDWPAQWWQRAHCWFTLRAQWNVLIYISMDLLASHTLSTSIFLCQPSTASESLVLSQGS